MARPEIEPKTPLAERLRAVRKGVGDVDRDDFSNLVGISKNTLAHYERGERTPDADVLRHYRDRCGIDLNWLITGEGEMIPLSTTSTVGVDHTDVQSLILGGRQLQSPQALSQNLGRGTRVARTDDLVLLPEYRGVVASAGPGAVAVSESSESVIAFARSFLRERGAAPDSCRVIHARGDSMAPTIPDASLLIVDHSQAEIANGCIMVIGVGDDLLVKRIHRRLDGLIDLVSDNPSYPTETIGTDRIQQLRIIGRVVYFCRAP